VRAVDDPKSWATDGQVGHDLLAQLWISVGAPGFSGINKAHRQQLLDSRFGADGWRFGHVVRGAIVTPAEAIVEYEESYRRFLRDRPALVEFLVTHCGNVYDDNVSNVFDDDYIQPHTAMNHYQDISVRRVISELVDDPQWPTVTESVAVSNAEHPLNDFGSGQTHVLPRARGFRGNGLLQIRDAQSLGFCLNPAVVPVHDPQLITAMPGQLEWYHREGCGHLSVEAFWQMSKVIEVR
jgi:hypothetical protein